MTANKHYTPPLRRDLVRRLYFAAKAERVPMTMLSNRIMEEALNGMPPILMPHPTNNNHGEGLEA